MENSREKFKQAFPDNHSLIVALHVQNLQHALDGARIAIENGAHGVAVVTHMVTPEYGAYIAAIIKEKYKYDKVLLNILQRKPIDTFKMITNSTIDWVWTDKAMIKGIDRVHEKDNSADELLTWQQENECDKLYFGGLDFKYQKGLSPEEYPFAVEQAKKYLDVITTSWAGTGISADSEKIKTIKKLAGDYPVGLASGISAENIHEYIPHTDISIVATAISNDYRNLNPQKVAELAKKIEEYNKNLDRKLFEKTTLEKYKMTSATELYTYLSHWEVINIGMHPEHNEAQKQLSNLYPSPFSLDGIAYASVEAFRMSIKYPENDPRHKDIRWLSGVKAKSAWKDARHYKMFMYQWKEIQVGSWEHHELLKRALRAKLEQNPEILKTLLDTENKKLTHIVFTRHENEKFILHDSKTIPGEKFAQLYTELREEFKNK